ncbi:MAG: methionine adenosyltransferase [Candidatus Nanohaloarchaea archaeon]
MNNIEIDESGDPIKKDSTELVERKGTGHPDSISDGIAESVSRALCREYRKRFGKILHHNTDEVQLVAGESDPDFGGGEIVDPIYILLTGRATKEFDGEKIPVDRIALEAAKDYIDNNFKVLSSDDIEFESKIGETSTDLKDVFTREGVPKSNDTSFGVGHAPLSDTERIVRNMEKRIKQIPAGGEDIKVMGLRRGDKMILTIAVAAIDSRIADIEEYIQFKKDVEEAALEKAREHTDLEVEVNVNTADDIDHGSVYITVTGTSAEMGDDGSVGRGNRVNGLITPNRSMSMEAASGKNPVTHVGKIYNLLSSKIAREINQESGEFAQVKILSQIGSPIDEPLVVHVSSEAGRDSIEEVVLENLKDVTRVTDLVVKGELDTF